LPNLCNEHPFVDIRIEYRLEAVTRRLVLPHRMMQGFQCGRHGRPHWKNMGVFGEGSGEALFAKKASPASLEMLPH